MDIYPPPAENIHTIRQIHKPTNCKILLEQFETKMCIGNRIRTLMQSEASSQVTSMYLQSHIFCVNNMLILSARPRLSLHLCPSVNFSFHFLLHLHGPQSWTTPCFSFIVHLHSLPVDANIYVHYQWRKEIEPPTCQADMLHPVTAPARRVAHQEKCVKNLVMKWCNFEIQKRNHKDLAKVQQHQLEV
jgi:hypothetical protein